jgi:hypothetical protein
MGSAVGWANAIAPTTSDNASHSKTFFMMDFIFSYPFQQRISALPLRSEKIRRVGDPAYNAPAKSVE